MSSLLLLDLRKELQRVADPAKAPKMQAYMKSEMPYHGVTSPRLKQACKQLFADLNYASANKWKNEVLAMWRDAAFREERYGALHLAGHRVATAFQTPASLPLYEELIVSGAWWDYVDDIAIHRVGPILGDYPEPMAKKISTWSKSQNIWKRRTAIICQVMSKERLDLDLLYQCIEPSMEADEFFLRKGIGWALRQVAWSEPDEVIRYVKRHRDRLSPLSKREALKNLLKSGRLKTIP